MSDPDHTAARLIAAAERLFAAGGEEATSLRAITREARSNAAAVHYHFGGRDELLRAVIDAHLGPVSERRGRLLELARAQDDPAAVVAAMVRPDLELLAALRANGRVQVARLLGRAHTLPGAAVAEFVARRTGGLVEQVLPLLRGSAPAVGDDELRQRVRMVLATVVFVFATAPDPGLTAPLGSDDVDEQVRRLVAFCAAGLAAPPAMAVPSLSSRSSSSEPSSEPSAEPSAEPSSEPSSEPSAKTPAHRARADKLPAKAPARSKEPARSKAPAGGKAAGSSAAGSSAAGGKAAGGKAAGSRAAGAKGAAGSKEAAGTKGGEKKRRKH